MSKETCTKCTGTHNEWQDCVVHWREMATYNLRQWEKCKENRAEDKALIKAQKEIAEAIA